MKLLTGSITLVCISIMLSFHEFNTFLRDCNKTYVDLNETYYRSQIYYSNLDYITEFNKLNRSYKLGMNCFGDLTFDEFSKTQLMIPKKVNSTNITDIENSSLPSGVDWRSMGVVTDIKDQGQCGSCWAFSAIGTIEGQHALKTNNLVSLSEQNLVDCSYNYGNEGCDGGWPEAAMRYVINNYGVDTEKNYPYTANDGSCAYNKSYSGANVTGTVNITSGNVTDLYRAIAEVGPISVAIDAEGDFQFYSAGIFESTECSSDQLDHAVLAVGYGISPSGKKYYIIKNSWGTSWGMDGYIYFSADIHNMCGIAQVASYPLV
jgi:cathepsin L